jgi:excisionase family DNA binding protein
MSTTNRAATLPVPDELIEELAERTANKVIERLPESAEGYLNVEQAAEYLSCEPHRIYDLRRQGLKCYRDGSRLLFRRGDLDAWLTKVES